MALRVGRIPFLNSEPFYRHLGDYARRSGVEVVSAAPRALAELARRGVGGLDAAPLPLTECFALEASFEPLGRLGIAVRGPVRSVLVFSDAAPDRLSGLSVSVTEETSCSAALLRVLLERRWGCTGVRFERSSEDRPEAAARLEIGDRALADRGSRRRHRLDLAEEWTRWTGLPFVFARWVVRRGTDAGIRRDLEAALEESLARSLAALDDTASRGDRLGLSRAESRAYLAAFIYRLGPEEESAAERFRALLGDGGGP